jgi:hypothetical protein
MTKILQWFSVGERIPDDAKYIRETKKVRSDEIKKSDNGGYLVLFDKYYLYEVKIHEEDKEELGDE